jgi:hypothetical protein
MMTELIIELSRINLWATGVALPDYGDSDYTDFTQPDEVKKSEPAKKHKKGMTSDEDFFEQQKEKGNPNETIYYPCDKKSELFVLQQDFIKHNRGYALAVPTNDSR